ncbi:uncharacterized protein LOC114717275 isoform X1 [Neltuma alba]|uniref:uncharacterized protein LOC114717275 isoform X1 n=1 Tax=Neltuma alba TaxID=207710 RepID=UPI0010A36624|nr:uncharacterized protein LOC114717275 isoform X1 [Prosopis alba]
MYSPANTEHDISNLESTFSKSFHIEDAEKSDHSSVGDDYCNTGEGGLMQQETDMDKTCLTRSANTSYSDQTLPPSSSDEELVMNDVIQADIAKTDLKPVSVMKGSREKQGGPRTKLTVKWAPDVYDPLPRSALLSVRSKRQHKSRGKKREKKNGKGQKSTYSRRVSGKDKKQYRISIETSDKCYKFVIFS